MLHVTALLYAVSHGDAITHVCRYSDFLVHEIDPTGQVVHLTNTTLPVRLAFLCLGGARVAVLMCRYPVDNHGHDALW